MRLNREKGALEDCNTSTSKPPTSRLLLAWALVALSPGVASATTAVAAAVTTGGDDLRGGNTLYIALNLVDGRRTREQVLSNGYGGNTRGVLNSVTFPETVDRSQVRSITLRHDGAPRSGHPFDTYDNWNLNAVAVSLGGVRLYDSVSDSRTSIRVGDTTLQRFTGAARTLVLPVRAIGAEPDFTIEGITRSPSGRLRVRVRNVGGGQGIVRSVACASGSGLGNIGVATPLPAGASVTIEVFAGNGFGVTCSVTGTTPSGAAEFNTSNNRRRASV